MELFESIVIKYGSKKRNNIPDTIFPEIEKGLGFKLPKDYKKFAENYTGFENTIGKEFLRLWDLEELIEVNSSYEITNELKNTLGIGSNGSGEFIAIERTGKNKYRIVLSPFIGLDDQFHIEIGMSFTDFLIRLENGVEWFT